MKSFEKYFFFIFIISLFRCSLEQGFVYSTKFFEPTAYQNSISKNVCLLPIENKDSLIPIYLTPKEFSDIPKGKNSEQDISVYNSKFQNSFLQYLKSKNLFKQIDFCEKQNQEYRIKLILEKYNWKINYPIHPIPSAMFLMGLPILIANAEYNLAIQLEVYKASEKLSEYKYKDTQSINILKNDIPQGFYRYTENSQTLLTNKTEIYLDSIYDRLIEKIYEDAKNWK